MAGVVAIHVFAVALAAAGAPQAWLRAWRVLDLAANSVCVPAFLFLTGALVWTGDPPPRHDVWWRRRLRVVFVPYAVWSAVYYLVAVLRASSPSALGALDHLRLFGTGLLTGTTHYHLYFPPLLLLVYALAPLARVVVRRSPVALLTGALALQGSLAVLYHFAPLPAEVHALAWRVVNLLPFAAFGALLVTAEERLHAARFTVAISAMGGCMLIGAQCFGLLPLPSDPFAAYPTLLATTAATGVALLGAGALLSATSRRFAPVAAPTHRVAALSYGVYLAHPLVLMPLRAAVLRGAAPALWSSPALVALAYAGVLAAALTVVWLAASTPITAWTVGVIRPSSSSAGTSVRSSAARSGPSSPPRSR